MGKKAEKNSRKSDFSIQSHQKITKFSQELNKKYGKDAFLQFTKIIDELKKDNLSSKEIVNSLLRPELKKDQIPISIFSNIKLSPSEIIIKYLRENLSFKFREIADSLNRNIGAVSLTYRNAKQKMPEPLSVQFSELFIPISLFKDRKLSILEHIVSFLSNKGISLVSIAKLLCKSYKTIWTISARARRKHES